MTAHPFTLSPAHPLLSSPLDKPRSSPQHPPVLPIALAMHVPPHTMLLLLGAAGLYAASRAGADAIARRDVGPRPGLLALGHWAPVAFVAWLASAAGRADVAMGVLFGTSVAALSLVMGMTSFVAPANAPPHNRRAWPFLLAAAMLPLVAGFSGRLTPTHALMMLTLGATVLLVWTAKPSPADATNPTGTAEPSMATSEQPVSPMPTGEKAGDGTTIDDRSARASRRSPIDRVVLLRAGQWLLSLALAYIAARAVLAGTLLADGASDLLKGGILATTVLSPLLVLPLLSTGTDLAQRGRGHEACDAYVAFAFLNLCLLLPALALLWYVRSTAPAGTGVLVALASVGPQSQAMPLPQAVWRIDAVFLVVLSLLLAPVGLGRWTITRLEAAVLVVGYAAYLAVTSSLARGGR